MKQKDLQEVYFRFLNFLKAVEELPNLPKLDAIESQLLNVIALNWNNHERLLVSDAIALKDIGSPATLHNRLRQLREKNMIGYVIESDGRKKYIEPTDLALKYFSQFSQAIVRAADKK